MEFNVGIFAAFLAGSLSFLSPCVLPLVPGYIAFISGESLEDLMEGHRADLLIKASLNSLFFGAGFTIIFVLLGAAATAAGSFIFSNVSIFRKVAGIIVVIFGLHVSGLVPLGFLDRGKGFVLKQKPSGLLGSVVVGAAFAFAWTPCLGPILAAILTYAGTQESVDQGMVLLTTYSLGLGVPFFLTALGVNRAIKLLGHIKRYVLAVKILSGVLLVSIGLLIFSNNLQWFSYYFASLGWLPTP